MHSSDWLEPVLSRHLAPTAAPDRLREMVLHPREQSQKGEFQILRYFNVVIAAAALMTVAMVVWAGSSRWSATSAAREIEAHAIEVMVRGPEHLEFHSGPAGDVRDWVKVRTGLDIPFTQTSRTLVSTGVCALKSDARALEIAYRVRGHNAALLVCRAKNCDASDRKHRDMKCEMMRGARVSSWTMQGQLYTLAYSGSGSGREECVLCHSGAEQLSLSN